MENEKLNCVCDEVDRMLKYLDDVRDFISYVMERDEAEFVKKHISVINGSLFSIKYVMEKYML